jgi:hypothetical protein
MIWLLIGLAIAFVVVVFCACRVSGQQDAAAAELERAMREKER